MCQSRLKSVTLCEACITYHFVSVYGLNTQVQIKSESDLKAKSLGCHAFGERRVEKEQEVIPQLFLPAAVGGKTPAATVSFFITGRIGAESGGEKQGGMRGADKPREKKKLLVVMKEQRQASIFLCRWNRKIEVIKMYEEGNEMHCILLVY